MDATHPRPDPAHSPRHAHEKSRRGPHPLPRPAKTRGRPAARQLRDWPCEKQDRGGFCGRRRRVASKDARRAVIRPPRQIDDGECRAMRPLAPQIRQWGGDRSSLEVVPSDAKGMPCRAGYGLRSAASSSSRSRRTSFAWNSRPLRAAISRRSSAGARLAAVLNRKRDLSIGMIRRLHDQLGISADVLIRPVRKSAA
jgi:hypothetical protein